MSERRVVVTGLGVVSPLGSQLETFLERLLKGQSGIRRITHFDTTGFTSQIAGEVVEFQRGGLHSQEGSPPDGSVLPLRSLRDPVGREDSGLDFTKEDASRCGVLLGSGIGGLQIVIDQMDVLRQKGPGRFSPFMIPQMITNILAGYVAIEYGLQGPNFCITSATTGTHCLGESMRMIRNGETDIMIAGGTEGAVCELGVGGFCAMRALSTRNDAPEKASRRSTRGGMDLLSVRARAS